MKTLSHATRYEISRDTNGNKVCRVKVDGFRAFSIQTNGNMPRTNRNGFSPSYTPNEVCGYVREFGTEAQKSALNIY